MSRIRFLAISVAVFLVQASSDIYGATFRNLGFEEADVSRTEPWLFGRIGLVADLLPGWAITDGALPSLAMGYNSIAGLGGPSLYDTNNFEGANHPPTEGRYALWFGEGGTLSQRGDVPATAQSLIMDVGDAFSLSINGSLVPLLRESGKSYAAISEFAGQNVELALTSIGSGPTWGFHELDNIRFSADPIPEPSTWALLICGGVVLSALLKKD